MLPSFMAAIVFLAAEAFGYSSLRGARKQVARGGVGIMLGGIALYSGVYTVSAIGTFAIPAWFPSGPGGVNGIAMDDTMTGLVGVGALILAAVMLPEVRGSFRRAAVAVKERFNPVRAGVYMTYLMATVAMFLYGYYIEMNESKFGFNALPAAHAVGDQVFTRTHLLLVFCSLPIIAVFLLAAELLGDTSGIRAKLKRWMAGSVLTGMVVATSGMGIWVFSTPSHTTSWDVGNGGAVLYIVGQALILLGAAVELFTTRSVRTEELSPISAQHRTALSDDGQRFWHNATGALGRRCPRSGRRQVATWGQIVKQVQLYGRSFKKHLPEEEQIMVEDIAELVANHPVLADLPGDIASLVSGCAHNVAVDSGERLLVEGEAADTLYLLRRGRVSLEVRAPGRGGLVIDILGPGTAAGWSWLFPPYRSRFDARAIEPVGAIAVDAACFRAKMESDPAFGYALLKRFASIMLDRLEATQVRLLDLYGDVPAGVTH